MFGHLQARLHGSRLIALFGKFSKKIVIFVQ